MEADSFEEAEFFAALEDSGARVMLIGRKALVALGLPVLTADYDLWLHTDDIALLNAALAKLDHFPNATPEQARARGRYVIENGEHIDVMVARAKTATTGQTLTFEEAWGRRQRVPFAPGRCFNIPALDDLICTKAWAMRSKDVADIQLLEALKRSDRAPR